MPAGLIITAALPPKCLHCGLYIVRDDDGETPPEYDDHDDVCRCEVAGREQ